MRQRSVYDIIKKQNGEHFAQMVRKFDSSLFEIENLPHILKYAGRSAEPLLDFLIMLKNVTIQEGKTCQNPFDLLKKAGYRAFLADTRKKQNMIAPFFAKGEELCTFEESDRYQNYFIIHCIKEGAEKLNRADFEKPEREDEYGTSVISIQILKRGGFIKITNRYNHTVEFADNTFKSNPDRIIEGLAWALKMYFKVDFSSKQVPLPDGYLYLDGQIVEYEEERDHIYFGKNYFIENEHMHFFNKDYQFVMDRFVLDLKERKILNPLNERDSFPKVLTCELQNKKNLHVQKVGKNEWQLLGDRVQLLHVSNGKIKKICLPTTKKIPPCFLACFSNVEELWAPQAQELGRNSLTKVPYLQKVLFHSLRQMGEKCVSSSKLSVLYMPQIQKIGDQCFCFYSPLRKGGKIEKLNLPLLKEMGWNCFSGYQIEELYLPSCEKIGAAFASPYHSIQKAYLPQLQAFPENSKMNEGDFIFAPKIVLNKKNMFLTDEVLIGTTKVRTME